MVDYAKNTEYVAKDAIGDMMTVPNVTVITNPPPDIKYDLCRPNPDEAKDSIS